MFFFLQDVWWKRCRRVTLSNGVPPVLRARFARTPDGTDSHGGSEALARTLEKLLESNVVSKPVMASWHCKQKEGKQEPPALGDTVEAFFRARVLS